MKGVFGLITRSLVLVSTMVVGFALEANAKPGVHDCQQLEAMQICVEDDGGSLLASYGGYLKDSGKPVHLRGTVNGEAFDFQLSTFGAGQTMFTLIAIPRDGRKLDISIYAVDLAGRYDSHFGSNYGFRVN